MKNERKMTVKYHYTLSELASYLQAELKGDPQLVVTAVAALDKACPGQISFFADPRYQKYLNTTQATAIIIDPQNAKKCPNNLLIMKNPHYGYARVAALFERKPQLMEGIHRSAVIGEGCNIAHSVSIGAHCSIGNHVSIAEGTVIHPGCVISDNVQIGSQCLMWGHVAIYHGVRIGQRAVIHSGAVIGSDGFGMVQNEGAWHKIPQLGGVQIGDDVEIGANTTIDRGALEDTIIENGVKLDNHIQIAHNVQIGAHTVIAGCTAIAGSTRIGKYCMIGGAVAINGHIEITDQVILTATATVSSSIKKSGVYSSGVPLQDNRTWRKNAVRFQGLDKMARQLKKLVRVQG